MDKELAVRCVVDALMLRDIRSEREGKAVENRYREQAVRLLPESPTLDDVSEVVDVLCNEHDLPKDVCLY